MLDATYKVKISSWCNMLTQYFDISSSAEEERKVTPTKTAVGEALSAVDKDKLLVIPFSKKWKNDNK